MYSYDQFPVNYIDTVMYVDPITRQIFEYANQIPWKTTDKIFLLLTLTMMKFMSKLHKLLKKTLIYPLNPLKFKPL